MELNYVPKGVSGFEDNKTLLVETWRPSASKVQVTDYDTAHGQAFVQIESMPHRLLWILECELSRGEMMSKLGLTHRTNFNQNYLDTAFDKGWIEMTIPDKP